MAGPRGTLLEADGCGHWRIDAEPAPHLDVDLASSAMTNALPVHRMALGLGQQAAAPAAYVRALGLTVDRLEQIYVRVTDEDSQQLGRGIHPHYGAASARQPNRLSPLATAINKQLCSLRDRP